MKRIVFATCRSQPAVQPDDVPLQRALSARGVAVAAAPWNGPLQSFEQADLVVVRSTWDYHRDVHAFGDWLGRLATLPAVTVNDPQLMHWNRCKRYLLELRERGVAMPPTRLVASDAIAIAAAMDELELRRAVVKPEVGAGGDGLCIVRRDELASIERAVVAAAGQQVLVQPLLAEIQSRGETSLVFFDGQFSHAVVKRPRPDSILVHAEHGGSTARREVTADVVTAARSILDMLPLAPLYARVDMVLAESRALLMEVEVIEPELFLLHDDAAADRFADVLLARLA